MAFGDRIKAWWRRLTAPPVPLAGLPVGRWAYKTALIEISPRMTATEVQALHCAMTFWNYKFPALFFATHGGIKAELGYPPRSGVVTITSHPPVGGPEVRAAAELFFEDRRGGLIRGAHIEVRPSMSGEALQRSIAHELGHVLGLGHTHHPLDHLMGLSSAGWVLLDSEIRYVREGLK